MAVQVRPKDSAGNSPANPSYTTTLLPFKAKAGTKLVWQTEGRFGIPGSIQR